MIYVIFVGVPVAAVAAVVVFVVIPAIDRPERRARRAGFPEPEQRETLGLGPRPPEIAHELSPFPPRSSPAGLPPPSPAPGTQGGGRQPGTAAAAGDTHLSPPPLPDPAYATANPSHPFAWWADDTFAEAMTAKGGAS